MEELLGQVCRCLVKSVKCIVHSVMYVLCWLLDHVAVRLFLRGGYAGLHVFLPCRWIRHVDSSRHEDTGESHWSVNPGKSANSHHRSFSTVLGTNTLQEIEEARCAGAILLEDSKGFHARNSKVAGSDHLLAFTWSEGSAPTSGGTLNTWTKCVTNRLHISLQHLSPSPSSVYV